MISRVTMRQSGLADYLENGRRADSMYKREEKDNAIPLYGSLSVLKKAEEHCIEIKNWSNNYEHITISFSDEDEQVLNDLDDVAQGEVLNDISLMMIKHRTSGYDIDNEVIAYAECHDPKIKQEINIRTGILQKRRKHIHIGISYLNPLSDTKLRTTFFNNSYISDTIDRYIAKKHGLSAANANVPKHTPQKNIPTKVALERKNLIKELADIQTQEALITYLENKEIKYQTAKGKNGTYLKVINPHGKNINLRGKDFKHLEIISNNQLNASQKQQHLKELQHKSLQELGDILETYYKKYRIPMINERRNEKTTQVLHTIYKQEQPSTEKEVNAFSSFQEKLFYKHYKHLVTTDLRGYSVDTKDSEVVTFIHKEKEITVKDQGDKITANSSTKNLEEKVRLMIDIAKAKGWNLATVDITGSETFKKEAHQQIADILREQEQKKEIKIPAIKEENQRVKTPIQYQAKVDQEKREAKELPLSELKQMLEAKRVLYHAVQKYKLDPRNYEITTDNKINNISNRQKPKNVIDFLQKEISLSSKEAILECQILYKNQPLDLSSDTANKKEHTILLCINTENDKNTTPKWETVKAKDYIELVTLMKTYPYKSASSQDNKANSNTLLIYDIENKEEHPQFTLQEAKYHFKNKGIDVILLPNTQTEKSSQSYKVMIPITQAIETPMDEETHKIYHKQILKELGLERYVDPKDLQEKEHTPSSPIAEPIIIESDNVMNIDICIKQAIEARTKEKKIEVLKSTLKSHTNISNTIEEQTLTYIDTEAMMQTSISLLVDAFENYHQSNKEKYTFIDDTLAHDFKNDIIYNPLTYLQIQLKTEDKEILAKALEKITGKHYIKTNYYAVKTALTQAFSTATDARALEASISKYFSCKVCTLEKEHMQIGSIKVDFRSIDTNREKIILELKGNKEIKHPFKAQQKEKSKESKQNNNRGLNR